MGNPTGAGGQVAGAPSRNPSGLSKEEAEARAVMRKWLAGGEVADEVRAAYFQLLKERNHVIVIDAMNRLAGKVKDVLEATGEDGAPLIPLSGPALTELIDLLRARKK